MQTISSLNPARTPRRIIAISIGLLSTLLLASCGSGVSTDQKATAQSADEGTKTIQAVSGSTTISGTSTGSVPKMEVINGITVPPEPAPSINNATLAGVDVNNNGVRDDVERMIARTATQKEFNVTIDYASRNNYAIANSASSKTRADALNMIKKISCFDAQGINPEKFRRINRKSIMSTIYNTPERMSALSAFSSLIGGYNAEEVVCDGDSSAKAPVLNISGTIPFQQSQLDASGTIADIDKVVGVIKNQYWVTNYLIQPDDILSELRKLPLLNVVAYRKSFGGYLIELDLENPAAVEQLRILQANLAFAVDARPYIGRALNKNFSRTPDDGSPSNDGANQPL